MPCSAAVWCTGAPLVFHLSLRVTFASKGCTLCHFLVVDFLFVHKLAFQVPGRTRTKVGVAIHVQHVHVVTVYGVRYIKRSISHHKKMAAAALAAARASKHEDAAQDLFSRAQFSAAVLTLNQAIYLNPDSAALYAQRAEALLRLCDLQSAITNLRKAHKLSLSAEAAAAMDLAAAAVPQDPSLATPLAPEGESSAVAAASQTAQHASRLARVLDLRAVALIEEGAHAEAAPLLSEALALLPSLRSLWLHRALARTGLEQYEDALMDLAQCVEMDGNDPDVHFLRAKLSLLAGNLEGARRATDRALQLRPDHPEAAELQRTMSECADVYSEEATKLILLGSPADAVSNLTHAMSLKPNDPHLLMRRGAARRQNGQLLEAARDFEAAIRHSGGRFPNGARLLVLTFNDLGVQLAAQKRYTDAIGWFHRATAMDDTIGQVFLNRGDCKRALGDIDAALGDFEKAAELFTGDAKSQWAIQSRIAMIHNERGAQLFNHAAARHAAVEFSRAIECNPRVAHFYINRAKATLELKRYDLARDDVLAALKLNPGDETAQRMLANLSCG